MDRTVPPAAALLLDFVRKTEVGTEDRSGYDVIYGFNQGKLPKPVTKMTVDEVQANQASWSSRFGSSATGGYQFMRATLGDLKRELGLSGRQVMDPNLQDRLAYHLLKRRGYEAFIEGKISLVEFGKRMAQEWASFPVLANTKGAHRQVVRGQSYYSGDKLNKALVSPEEYEEVLKQAFEIAQAPTVITKPEVEMPSYRDDPSIGHNGGPRLDEPTPVQKTKKAWGAGGAAGGAAVLVPMAMRAAVAFGLLPAEFGDDAVIAAFTSIIAAIAAWIGAYMPRNAE